MKKTAEQMLAELVTVAQLMLAAGTRKFELVDFEETEDGSFTTVRVVVT